MKTSNSVTTTSNPCKCLPKSQSLVVTFTHTVQQSKHQACHVHKKMLVHKKKITKEEQVNQFITETQLMIPRLFMIQYTGEYEDHGGLQLQPPYSLSMHL